MTDTSTHKGSEKPSDLTSHEHEFSIGTPWIKSRWGVRSLAYRIVKRAFDIAFSVAAITLLAIPALGIALAIRLDSPGPAVYVIRRVDRIDPDGTIRTFPMLKFRSMYQGAEQQMEALLDKTEAEGGLFKIKDDPRITRVGKFLRMHSLDELPQFLNSLVGQLSIVGPRPPLQEEVAPPLVKDLETNHAIQLERLSVKPGITGLWQIRNDEYTSFDEMATLDRAYVEHQSIALDLRIMLRTIRVMITGRRC